MRKNNSKLKSNNKNLPVPANSLEKYLTEISNYEILSREEEARHAKEYRDSGNRESARKLITANLKFVVKIAMEYKNYGLNLMDVIQEGNLGLMQAVTKFDPTKRYRLISYGVWWIRAYIQNFIMKNWSLVKIGTTQGQRKLFYKIRSAKSLYNSGDLSLEESKKATEKSHADAKKHHREIIDKTRAMFAIFDPITLLIAIAGELLKAAFILTINSGSEVAKATTVIPITSLEILNFRDKATDDLTINSPPITNNKNPKNIKNRFILIDD